MADLTPERLAELRRIAEAATTGPWERDGRIVYALTHYGYRNGIEQRANKVTISVQKGHDCSAEEADAVALHIATFDPTTVLEMLDEIERLRRLQQKVQSAAVLAVAAEQVLKAWVMGDYLAPFMDDLENALLDFDGPVASEAVWEDIEPDGEEGGGDDGR